MDEQAIKEERGVNPVLFEAEFRTDIPVLVQIKIEKEEENEVGDSPNSTLQEIHSIPTFEPDVKPPMLAQVKTEKEHFSFVSVKEEYEVDEPLQRGVKIEIDIEDDSYKETISDLIFKCDYCYEEFSEKSMLECHMSVHLTTSFATNRKYECNICSHSFVSSHSLDQHRVLVHKLCGNTVSTKNGKKNKKGAKTTPKSNTQGEHEPYKCQFCDYTSFRIGWFNVHLKRMHPTENCHLEYKCPNCDYKATNSSKLKTHLMVHSNEKPYECKDCDYACKTSSRLLAHVKKHINDKPYECKVCDYKCKSKESMRKHSMIHGEKKFECDKCGCKFALNCYLTRHYRIHLEQKRDKFKCDLCNYASMLKSNVQVHYKQVHINMKENRYKCHLCDRRFQTNSNLAKHMRCHTGEKPYQCDICDYASATNNLKLHMMTHTGAKPFECDYCGYKCSIKGNLTNHIRIHMGDMRYVCEFCDYKSVSSSGLRKHLRKHHPRSQVVRF